MRHVSMLAFGSLVIGGALALGVAGSARVQDREFGPSENAVLLLRTSKARIILGEPLLVEVAVRNDTDAHIQGVLGPDIAQQQILVTKGPGGKTRVVENPQRAYPNVRKAAQVLDPHSSISKTILVDRTLREAFPTAGHYEIQWQVRAVGSRKAQLKSSWVTLDVAEPSQVDALAYRAIGERTHPLEFFSLLRTWPSEEQIEVLERLTNEYAESAYADYLVYYLAAQYKYSEGGIQKAKATLARIRQSKRAEPEAAQALERYATRALGLN